MTTGTVQTTESGELGLHIAARTVVGRCPAPLNAVEVAVVLETCGYTAKRARALGSDGLNALAERVFALVPLYSSALSRQALAPVAIRSRPPGPVDLARGLAYSSPWLVSLATLLISGVSFWSSNIAIPSIANAVTLATAVALLVTGPFIQAFGRRASFYIGLGDQGMVVRITRWTLEARLPGHTVVSGLALYLVRNDVLAGRHPGHGATGPRRRRRPSPRCNSDWPPSTCGAPFSPSGSSSVAEPAVLALVREPHPGRTPIPPCSSCGRSACVAVMAAVCWMRERVVALASRLVRAGRSCGALRGRPCSGRWRPTGSTASPSSPSWSLPSS